MIIRTPDYRLRVFVSSTLAELAEERKAVRQAILKMHLAPVMFEAGARPHPAHELYRSYLSQSQVFIGIYWQRYGWVAPGMDISGLEDEYALSNNLPRLIYIKTPSPEREPGLKSLLDRIRDDNTSSYSYFSTSAQLKELVQNDLALLLTERFETVSHNAASEIDSQPHPLTNVPIPRNPLVDRQEELKKACRLLLEADTALLTLTGPGGTGKSRIAIQVGRELLPSFEDGVFMVRLESVTNPDFVMQAIAECFNLRESAGSRRIAEILQEYLRDQQLLLILDNFEQVIQAAPRVAELLEACPRVKCLVTSRAPLRLRFEKELPIPPLTFPGHKATDPERRSELGALPVVDKPPVIEELSQYSAVELFIQRSQAVKSDFAVTNANAPAVAEICSRLDGLPLAIELAAARIKLFTPEGLLARLEHRFDVLKGGTRDLPERQRTLRGAIDWSYNLLGERECKLFRRLAVFNGGCSLEAAETVCNVDGDLDTCLDDMLEALIDNNLVIHLESADGEPRFGMLSTIHDYAHQRLVESGEDDILHEKHALFYSQFTEDVEPRIRSSERDRYQQVMQQEMGNIREVFDWACSSGKSVAVAQKIFITLGIFWHLCGYITEGSKWGQKLLALCDDSTPDILRAGILCFTGMFDRAQSKQEAAIEALDKSLEILRRHDDKFLLGNALIIRGMIAEAARDLDMAENMFSQTIKICTTSEMQWLKVVAVSWLGDVAVMKNDLSKAAELHEESVRLGRLQGDPWCLMPALMASAEMDIMKGDFGPAYNKATEIMDVLRKSGDHWSQSWTLLDLGYILYFQGDLERASACSLEALSLANTFGNLGAMIVALVQVAALVARRAQDPAEPGLFVAAQLCGATASSTSTPGIFTWINTRKLYEDALTEARSHMSPEIWEVGFKDGQGISLDQAIKFANQALTAGSGALT